MPSPSRLLAVPAFALAAGATFALWWVLGRPVDLPEVPGGRLACVSYTPYDGGQTPLDRDYTVPSARIEADLAALLPYTGCVRTYSARGPQGEVVRIATRLGMQVLLGVWISGDRRDDAAEIEAGLTLARAHPESVRALLLGNEVLLRRELTGGQLATLIRSVKPRSPVPVSYADIAHFWLKNPVVAEAVDVLTVHVLPYWDDPAPVGIDEVQAHVRGIIERARRILPPKPFIVGEIGWPSAGRPRAAAVPGRVNQARFVREFAIAASAMGVDYNIIEGIDQPWKRVHEGTVGGYWGVLDKNRTLKFPFAGPVSEWPRWPLAFAASAAIGALLLLVTVWRGRPLPAGRWLLVAGLGQALGIVLVLQAGFAATASMTAGGWIGGAAGALLAIAAAAALLSFVVDGEGAWARVPPLALREALAWLRRPSRAGADAALLLGAMHGLAALGAAYLSITLAFDSRHRDIPLALFGLPAAAALVRWLMVPGTGIENADDRREEGWLALVLLIAGAFALDGPANWQAMAWLALALALALPWLGFARAEALRIVSPGLDPGRAQQSDQHAGSGE
ncbi:MAG: glycoside hydrolase family 17 [Proteobacteria bacterium]|nr:glycoside hydrolase family 17 [Pseudomonadota bacterium]